MRFSIPTLATLATVALTVTASPTPNDNSNLAARDAHKFHHGVFNVDKRSLEQFRRDRIVILPRQNNSTTTTTPPPKDTTTTTKTTTDLPPTNVTTTPPLKPTDKPDDEDDKDDEEDKSTTKTTKTTTKTTITPPPKPVTTKVIHTVTAEDGAVQVTTTDLVVTETPQPTVIDVVEDATQTEQNPALATSGAEKKALMGLTGVVVAGLAGFAALL
ncbi:hypothetical protein BJ508DRAFT_413759 [Ascobolus immersus RN42]|uniref:Uncharacterized protein n=1 Tax=Ascobolus immersus RN42 TaxID=1160509 RepID=A0A3N4IG50_ASCIM|nr:hypothetical protein BJ508DRAFT_413759 [Ascobolus immersus RN42]